MEKTNLDQIRTDVRRFKATPNHRNRTYTIRVYCPLKGIFKYRTKRLPKDEFEGNLHNSQQEWREFLKTSHDYYPVENPRDFK